MGVLLLALALLRSVSLDGNTHHVQGIAVDGSRLWVTSVDGTAHKGLLFEYDLESGKQLRSVELQVGEMYHPGGFDHDYDSLWIPVAEYRPASKTIVQRRSKETLEILSSFEVADHIGCLTLTPAGLMGANWDARRFYEWTEEGVQTAVRPNPNLTRYQEIKYRYGALIASGNAPKPGRGGAVEWLEPQTLSPLQRETFSLTTRGVPYTNEGMDVRDGRLYLLPEDSPSRLFMFDLTPASPGNPGQ
jgi:hypothetical protein